MPVIIIDLMGNDEDDDIIVGTQVLQKNEEAQKSQKKHEVKDLPQLQIVEIEITKN